MASLDAGNAGRIQAAHLASAHTHGHAVLAKHDSVGFDVLGDLPGKQQVLQLGGGRLQFADYFQVTKAQLMVISGLHQEARADALDVDCIAASVLGGQVNLQNPHIDFGLEHLQRFRREAGRHQHLHKLFGDFPRSALVQQAVQGNDAAEGRGGVGPERLAVGLQCIASNCYTTWVGVLDDDASGLAEALDALPGGIRIGNVVVAHLFALQLPGHDE